MSSPGPEHGSGTSAAVKSADRVLMLLEYLADNNGATFAEIVRDLDLPNSSAHQLLRTIHRRGFIEFDDVTRMYTLGLRLWEIARTYSPGHNLAEIAQPFIDELNARTMETIQLARLDGLENIYLAIAESPHPMKLVSSVGHRLPAHATGLGKALLAQLPAAELNRRLEGVELQRFTDNTIRTHDELHAELHRIRRRGYAEDREEYVIGCRCVAMPIRAVGGDDAIAALSVSVPTPRYNQQVARQVRTDLCDVVRQLDERLGSLDD